MQYSKWPSLCLLVTLLLLFSFSKYAIAFNTQDAQKEVLQNDKNMLQGTVKYTDTLYDRNAEESVKQSVTEQKKYLRSIRLPDEFKNSTNDKFNQSLQESQKVNAVPAKIVFSYLPDRRFRRIAIRELNQKHNKLDVVYDGQDQLLITDDQQVVIMPNRPFELQSVCQMINLGPAPSFALGRGLSILIRPTYTDEQGSIVLRGTAPDTSEIIATLDSQHGCVARQITRNANGHKIGQWKFGSAIKSKQGFWIASSAIYEAYDSNDALLMRHTFDIKEADFTKPDDKLFTFPLHQGLLIDDLRQGVPAVFKKTSPGIISKAELSKITNKFVEQQADDAAKVQASQRQETLRKSSNVILPVVIIITFILCASAYMRFKRQTGS